MESDAEKVLHCKDSTYVDPFGTTRGEQMADLERVYAKKQEFGGCSYQDLHDSGDVPPYSVNRILLRTTVIIDQDQINDRTTIYGDGAMKLAVPSSMEDQQADLWIFGYGSFYPRPISCFLPQSDINSGA